MRILILIPVYDDWTAATMLLTHLAAAFADARLEPARVLLVDDGSFEPVGDGVDRMSGTGWSIEILRLRRNVGHQRAIAIGLAYIEQRILCDAVVVMDGDGEDRPEDVPRLLAALDRHPGSVVFAERTRRSEGVVFLIFYAAFRALHLILTSERVRVGNFSVVPREILMRLVAVSDLWNHYAAAIFKARFPFETIPTTRGRRYAGRSHMNWVALVTHGLSAMSVFGDRIGVRLLTATIVAAAALAGAVAVIVAAGTFSGATFPSWAPYVLALVAVFLFQAFALSLMFVFIVLTGRGGSSFLPLRDYAYFVARVDRISAAADATVPVRG